MGLRDFFQDQKLQTRAMILPALFALVVINLLLKLYMG
jgi:hypothetical protein